MLDSWNTGAAKSAIVDFVARVTKENGKDYVPLPSASLRSPRRSTKPTSTASPS